MELCLRNCEWAHIKSGKGRIRCNAKYDIESVLLECGKNIVSDLICIFVGNNVPAKHRHSGTRVSHPMNNVSRTFNVISSKIFGMQGLPRVYGVTAIGMARGTVLLKQRFAATSGLPLTAAYRRETSSRQHKKQDQLFLHPLSSFVQYNANPYGSPD